MESKKTTEKSPNQAVNELIAFITPLAEGDLVPEFNQKLHELVKAVTDTGKNGTINLALKVEFLKGSRNQIVVHSDVKLNKPELTKPTSLYYSDEDGGLFRNDPNQMRLFGKEE